jgi:hypothetical protein
MERLRVSQILPSMSRPANPYDNATCESFLKTLSCDAQICLNVGFALAACGKLLCARGVHEPDIPSAGARATSARITALPCLVSSGSKPAIGCNGLVDRCR